MNLKELLDYAQMGAVGIVLILLGMIKLPKIEISSWTWLGHRIGKALNAEVIDKVDEVAEELSEHIQQEEEEKAKAARRSFLRFNDELLEGKEHSKEHFDEILDDMDKYDDYCEAHPLYKNHKADLAMENIRTVYSEKLRSHRFLGPHTN